ncbi:MAG: ribonuclease P protein component [Bacteroidota bacterium]
MDKASTTSYRFYKKERLKSHTIIARLFEKGQSFGRYPLRLVWLEMARDEKAQVQVAFSVPKKKFKSAVDRNRIKRQLREAWRLNKHLLYGKIKMRDSSYVFMIIYVAKEKVSYREIEKNAQRMIQKFVEVSAVG